MSVWQQKQRLIFTFGRPGLNLIVIVAVAMTVALAVAAVVEDLSLFFLSNVPNLTTVQCHLFMLTSQNIVTIGRILGKSLTIVRRVHISSNAVYLRVCISLNVWIDGFIVEIYRLICFPVRRVT